MSQPDGLAPGITGASGARRYGARTSVGRSRPGLRGRVRGGRALGVCALAASVPAFAAGAVPLGVALIGAAQVAFAAALLARGRERGIHDDPGVGWTRRPLGVTRTAAWPVPARPASLWRPSPGDWPSDAPDLELNLN